METKQKSRYRPRVILDEERIKRLKDTIADIQNDSTFTNSNYLRKLKKQLEELENKQK